MTHNNTSLTITLKITLTHNNTPIFPFANKGEVNEGTVAEIIFSTAIVTSIIRINKRSADLVLIEWKKASLPWCGIKFESTTHTEKYVKLLHERIIKMVIIMVIIIRVIMIMVIIIIMVITIMVITIMVITIMVIIMVKIIMGIIIMMMIMVIIMVIIMAIIMAILMG